MRASNSIPAQANSPIATAKLPPKPMAGLTRVVRTASRCAFNNLPGLGSLGDIGSNPTRNASFSQASCTTICGRERCTRGPARLTTTSPFRYAHPMNDVSVCSLPHLLEFRPLPLRLSPARVRRFLIACILLMGLGILLPTVCLGGSAQPPNKQHILVLHSYHEGLTWTDGENQGIKNLLHPHAQIELSIEYLDSKRIPLHEIEAPFASFLKKKYAGTVFDAIIVSDNNALEFFTKQHEALFPRVPIIFCGINNFTPRMLERLDGLSTGVTQTLDPEGTIDLIQKLEPNLHTLAIVSGTTPTARAIRDKVKSVLGPQRDDVHLLWLDELDIETLQERLASLSALDAVLLCNFNRDRNGAYFSHEESARIISRASNAPVYAMEDHYLGTGIVGGYMNASEDQGRVAATLCLEWLHTGIMPEIDMNCPNRAMFDYSALLRLGLDSSRLPDSAILINRPVSFYQDHGRLIWNTLILFSLLLLAFFTAVHGYLRSRRAERRLRASEENLRTTLDSIGDAVIATDINGNVVRMNPVAQNLTGWEMAEASGKPLTEVFDIIHSLTRKPMQNPVENILEHENVTGVSERSILIARNGSEHQIADSAAPIRNRSHRIIGIVLVFRDVTEEYALHEQLQHAQKMEAIGLLAGGVAHDFNNMLGGIMGAAELMKMETESTPEFRKYHSIIIDSVHKAAELTSKLLSFARKQQLASTAVDIHVVVQESVTLLESSVSRKIHFEVALHADAHHVVGDPTQLQSAIMNLAINATHAMPEGGTISITSRIVELDETYCTKSTFNLAPGTFVEIEVRDNGEGIPPENLPRIFEPFFTTKAPGKGTGLGLPAVFGTIQQHHGAILVYSEVAKGSHFHIYLPVTEDRVIALEHPKPLPGSGTVLIVDDEPLMRAVGKAMLENLGYTVDTAENGADGLECYKQGAGKYDLVLLDMIMPVMSGKECFDALRAEDPNICVVLSSGFTREEDLGEMKQNGLRGFISKPFLKNELSQVIRAALQEPRPSD